MKRILLAGAALIAGTVGALAQTAVLDSPLPAFTGAQNFPEVIVESYAVSGGTIYWTQYRQPGSLASEISSLFVPVAAGGIVRYLPLMLARNDTGLVLTATPGTPTGGMGISRTAGSLLSLTGEATSGAAAKTNVAVFDTNLPDSYQAGANIVMTVNCATSGTTITAATTTMTVAAYTEVNGVEALLTVSAAQQIPATAGDLAFTITGTGLVPGQHIVYELTMLVTTSAGAGTGHVYSVRYTG